MILNEVIGLDPKTVEPLPPLSEVSARFREFMSVHEGFDPSDIISVDRQLAQARRTGQTILEVTAIELPEGTTSSLVAEV